MEKYAFEIVEDVMEKCARSYNAKRKKQYWQMMKDIHGGTDKAVENITKGRHMDSLLAKHPSWEWDYDQQFGNYGEHINISRNNGNKRLKTPSELWDSTELYPAKTIDPDIATYRTRPTTGRPISFYKNDFSNELLEDGDFTSTYLKFKHGKPDGGNRSFKELDERAQALGKKIAPPNLNRSQNDISLGEEISKASTKKSKKPILAGLGVAGAGAGAGIGSSVRKAIKSKDAAKAQEKLKSKDAAKAQEKLKKKMALGAGAGVAGVAGTLGAGAAYKHNNRDKAAFEIVNDILSK